MDDGSCRKPPSPQDTSDGTRGSMYQIIIGMHRKFWHVSTVHSIYLLLGALEAPRVNLGLCLDVIRPDFSAKLKQNRSILATSIWNM